MNVKNFLITGIVGGLVDFLLGWLFYGILFKDTFPMTGKENMMFIFLGCMSFGFLMATVYTVVSSIEKCVPGLKTGALIGLFIALYSDFFMNVNNPTVNYTMIATDIAVTVVMSSLVGAVMAVVNGKMK